MKSKRLGYRCLLSGLLLVIFFNLALLVVRAGSPRQASTDTCAVEYTVQADDWLSTLAAKYLDDVLAYPAIFHATNQQNTADPRFAHISDINVIEIGWLLCIPPLPPAPVEPVSSTWQPLPPADCDALAAALAQQFGVTPQVTSADFSTSKPRGVSGTGCRISLQETNAVFQVESGLELAEQVEPALIPLGWTLDQDGLFGEGAFTGVDGQFKQGYAQCWLDAMGNIVPGGVQCPEVLGDSSCFYEQPPEHQLYSLELTCAELFH